MDEKPLATLLDRNDRHVGGLARDHFDGVQEGQSPPVVSVCCADSRVSQERMWSVREPGWLFTPANIGNLAMDPARPQQVDGSLLYPVEHAGTSTIAIVGHTGCGALTAAYDVVMGGPPPEAAGVAARIEPLIPIVERGLEAMENPDRNRSAVIDELVEYNVQAQVQFLTESAEIPDAVRTFGFVYDLHGTYGGPRGRTYLVSADGVTAPAELSERAGAYGEYVAAE
jgi:carbonic anhydrase